MISCVNLLVQIYKWSEIKLYSTNILHFRVYLYKWPPGHTNGLLKIEQMKDKGGKILAMVTSPGLSAYAVILKCSVQLKS